MGQRAFRLHHTARNTREEWPRGLQGDVSTIKDYEPVLERQKVCVTCAVMKEVTSSNLDSV